MAHGLVGKTHPTDQLASGLQAPHLQQRLLSHVLPAREPPRHSLLQGAAHLLAHIALLPPATLGHDPIGDALDPLGARAAMRTHRLLKKRRLRDECAGLFQALARRFHPTTRHQRKHILGRPQSEQVLRRSIGRKEHHAALATLLLGLQARRDFSLGDLL